MEESGHYYSVYLTAIAVGYDNTHAFLMAFHSQLPDEIRYFDAFELHIKSLNPFKKSEFGNSYRVGIEETIHSLTGISGEIETKNTVNSLKSGKYRSLSLEFGLLLHRLGDSYAHRKLNGLTYSTSEHKIYEIHKTDLIKIGEKSGLPYQYTRNDFVDHTGHGIDEAFGHHPDEFWKCSGDEYYFRKKMYLNYINKLYFILTERIKEEFEYKPRYKQDELIQILNTIINNYRKIGWLRQYTLIYAIRELIESREIKMVKYNPEDINPDYMAILAESAKVNIDEGKLQNAFINIQNEFN